MKRWLALLTLLLGACAHAGQVEVARNVDGSQTWAYDTRYPPQISGRTVVSAILMTYNGMRYSRFLMVYGCVNGYGGIYEYDLDYKMTDSHYWTRTGDRIADGLARTLCAHAQGSVTQ